jgi:hypothetical protein
MMIPWMSTLPATRPSRRGLRVWRVGGLATIVSVACFGAAGAASGHAEAPGARAVDRTASALTSPSVPLASIDATLLRRALDFLERMRTEDGSPWQRARLGDAVPVYRPDAPAPSYYEFTVRDDHGAPAGYFVLSTSKRDYPIATAMLGGEAPSAVLVARARAEGRSVARIHRLDRGAWVAEDAAGTLAATLNGLPGKLEGYDASWLSLSEAARRGHAEGGPDGVLRELRTEVGAKVSFSTWPSWSALRKGYRDDYAPLLEAGRRAAEDDWRELERLEQRGETLQMGEFREIPLQDRGDAQIELRGLGAEYVGVEQVERETEGDRALAVYVERMPPAGVHPFEIVVSYADGTQEVLRRSVTRTIPAEALGASPIAASNAIGMALPSVAAQVSAQAADGVCHKMAIRTAYQTYVTAPPGNGPLTGTTPLRFGTIFDVDKSGSRFVKLRVGSRKVFTSTSDVVQVGTPPNALQELFEVTTSGPTGAIKAFDGKYVHGDSSGRVVAAERRPHGDDRLELMCYPTHRMQIWAAPSNDRNEAWRAQRKLDQLPAHRAPNNSQCASGCGPTAWAMLFGWADYEAARNIAPWTPFKGLYRAHGARSGPDATAPEWFWSSQAGHLSLSRDAASTIDPGAAAMIWELRSDMNDWAAAGCAADGGRWTAPHIMAQVVQYFKGRADVSLTADYDGAGIMTDAGRRNARGVIEQYHRPVILGTGYFAHYPVALGLVEDVFAIYDGATRKWAAPVRLTQFVTNPGHQEAYAKYVPYDSWFAGKIHPNKNSRD